MPVVRPPLNLTTALLAASVLGIGAGYGNPLLAFTYGPRLIAGGDGVGVRHGLMVHTLYDLLSLEVSHQVSFGAPTRQEVRLMIGVNAVPLAVGTLALLVGAFFTGSFAKALRQL